MSEGAPVQLREAGGKATVLVTLHSARCAGCREYVDGLSPLSHEFDVWDARLLVIVPGPAADTRSVRAPFGQTLLDEHGVIAEPASASVFVADRYGQIFDMVRAGLSHDLPSAHELSEWLKYLGTLCPE